MKIQNKTTLPAILATTAIVLISIVSILVLNSIFSINSMFALQTSLTLIFARTALSLLSLGLSAYLMFVYLQDYMELKSGFTLALLLTVTAFMFYSLTSNPILHSACGIYTSTGLFSIIPLFFSTIAMGILAWVSSK